MQYRIDRAALDDFVARQLDRIEATPVPLDVAQLAGAARPDAGLTADELYAVWLGAGLATQVGLALVDEPERFVVPTVDARAAG